MGDIQLVRSILDEAPSCIDDRLASFGSPVQLALALGDRDVAEELVRRGANLLQRDAATRKSLSYVLPLAMHDMDFVHFAYEQLNSQSDDARLRRLPRLSGMPPCGKCSSVVRSSRKHPALHSPVAAALAKVPDFECQIQFKFETWIPLAGLMLPTDTLTVSSTHLRAAQPATWHRSFSLRYANMAAVSEWMAPLLVSKI
jgi:hypothetical protein